MSRHRLFCTEGALVLVGGLRCGGHFLQEPWHACCASSKFFAQVIEELDRAPIRDRQKGSGDAR